MVYQTYIPIQTNKRQRDVRTEMLENRNENDGNRYIYIRKKKGMLLLLQQKRLRSTDIHIIE